MFERFGRAHPRLTALTVYAVVTWVFLWPILNSGPVDTTGGSGQLSLDVMLATLPFEVLFCAFVFIVVAMLRWSRAIRLGTPLDPAGVRVAVWVAFFPAGLWALMCAVTWAQAPGPDTLNTLTLILGFNILVGIFEETLFRGVLFHGFAARHGVPVAVAVSSVLFGAFHLVNLAAGQALALTLFQCLNATALGLVFCAVLLQTNSLWPAIGLHAIWNSYVMTSMFYAAQIPGMMPEGPAAISPGNFLLPAFLATLAVFLLARWHMRTGGFTLDSPPQQA